MYKMCLNILLLLVLGSCAPGDGGTTTGNPILVNMSFAPYNNALARRISNWFIPSAYADLNDLKLCFKRIRFKVDGDSVGDDVELELGEISVNQEGTDLGTIEVVDAVYKRIEFDLEKDCDGTTKPSVTLTTQYGTFPTDDRITIRFEGSFRPSEGDLTLFIQLIVDQVKNYQTSDGTIKDKLEAVSGTY